MALPHTPPPPPRSVPWDRRSAAAGLLPGDGCIRALHALFTCNTNTVNSTRVDGRTGWTSGERQTRSDMFFLVREIFGEEENKQGFIEP